MAGQNLLRQRGAGARHADNEDRRGIAVGGAGPVVQPGGVELRDARVDKGAVCLAVERLEPGDQPMALLP